MPALLPLPENPDRLALFEASTAFVAANDVVLGFGACTPVRIGMLFVDPPARGCGIGAALLARMLDTMPGAVELDVVASNTAALALYARAGFSQAAAEPAFRYNGVEVAVLRLRRPAGPSPALTFHSAQAVSCPD